MCEVRVPLLGEDSFTKCACPVELFTALSTSTPRRPCYQCPAVTSRRAHARSRHKIDDAVRAVLVRHRRNDVMARRASGCRRKSSRNVNFLYFQFGASKFDVPLVHLRCNFCCHVMTSSSAIHLQRTVSLTKYFRHCERYCPLQNDR